MRTILRGFMGVGLEELFPRPKHKPEAGMGSISDQVADLVAGTQAGFGKETTEAALKSVAEAFPHAPENRSPAADYLNTELLKLASQYDTGQVVASLKTLT